MGTFGEAWRTLGNGKTVLPYMKHQDFLIAGSGRYNYNDVIIYLID